MTSSESERRRLALQRTLDDLVVLLEKHRVAYGATVREIAGRVGADGEGLSTEDRHRLLGGLGSLTDVWISKRNGHDVDDERSANAELDRLRHRLREFLSPA